MAGGRRHCDLGMEGSAMVLAIIIVTIPWLALMFAVPFPVRFLFCIISIMWGAELIREGAPKPLTFVIFITTGIALVY